MVKQVIALALSGVLCVPAGVWAQQDLDQFIADAPRDGGVGLELRDGTVLKGTFGGIRGDGIVVRGLNAPASTVLRRVPGGDDFSYLVPVGQIAEAWRIERRTPYYAASSGHPTDPDGVRVALEHTGLGKTVHVLLSSGVSQKGRLTSIGADDFVLTHRGSETTISLADVAVVGAGAGVASPGRSALYIAAGIFGVPLVLGVIGGIAEALAGQ